MPPTVEVPKAHDSAWALATLIRISVVELALKQATATLSGPATQSEWISASAGTS